MRKRGNYAPHGIAFKGLEWASAFLSIAKAQGWQKRDGSSWLQQC
jgi:hypothetical protein